MVSRSTVPHPGATIAAAGRHSAVLEAERDFPAPASTAIGHTRPADGDVAARVHERRAGMREDGSTRSAAQPFAMPPRSSRYPGSIAT